MADGQRTHDRREAPPAPRARRRRRETRTSRIVPAACWTIIAVCVAAFATSLAIPLWYHFNDQRILLVTSGSMEPYFNSGDAVIVQRISDPSQLRINQVASFYPATSNQLVTHRIIDLKSFPVLEQNDATGRMEPVLGENGEPVMQQYIITKGDANDEPDPNATPWTNVRGIVLDVYPGMGELLGWAHSPQGRAVMLVPPLVLLAAMEIGGLVRERRRSRAETPREQEEVTIDESILLD